MAQQWEVCRVSSVRVENRKLNQYKDVIVIDFFSASGPITKWPALNSFAGMIGHLSVAGWELVTVQHADAGGASGDHLYSHLVGRLEPVYPDKAWAFERCEVVAYLKRPMESGRRIDDIFPTG